MNSSGVFSLIAAAVLVSAGTAEAQTHISIVSSSKNPTPKVCMAQARVVADVAARLPQTAGWTYFVVCDDSSWNNLLRDMDHLSAAGNTTYGTTDLAAKRTYFRGTSLISHEIGAPEPAFIVAHELAHVAIGNSGKNSEEAADKVARGWLAQQGNIAEVAEKR